MIVNTDQRVHLSSYNHCIADVVCSLSTKSTHIARETLHMLQFLYWWKVSV